jgi:hypothetical protein
MKKGLPAADRITEGSGTERIVFNPRSGGTEKNGSSRLEANLKYSLMIIGSVAVPPFFSARRRPWAFHFD